MLRALLSNIYLYRTDSTMWFSFHFFHKMFLDMTWSIKNYTEVEYGSGTEGWNSCHLCVRMCLNTCPLRYSVSSFCEQALLHVYYICRLLKHALLLPAFICGWFIVFVWQLFFSSQKKQNNICSNKVIKCFLHSWWCIQGCAPMALSVLTPITLFLP